MNSLKSSDSLSTNPLRLRPTTILPSPTQSDRGVSSHKISFNFFQPYITKESDDVQYKLWMSTIRVTSLTLITVDLHSPLQRQKWLTDTASLCTKYLQIFHSHYFVPHETVAFASDEISQIEPQSCRVCSIFWSRHRRFIDQAERQRVLSDLVKITWEFIYHLTTRTAFWICLRCAVKRYQNTRYQIKIGVFLVSNWGLFLSVFHVAYFMWFSHEYPWFSLTFIAAIFCHIDIFRS